MSTNRLSAARDAAEDARARHADDVAALARGRDRLTASEAEQRRVATDDEAAITRHARRLEKQTREGASGAPPALVPTDSQMAACVMTQRTHEAARRMVASLEIAARESGAALAHADEALRSAVLAAIGEEANVLAAAIEQLRAELKAKEELLSAVRNVPDFTPSAAVFRALRDDLNMPIAELGHGGDWDTPVGDLRLHPTPLDTATHWRQRIEQLTNGAPASPLSSAAA
jgi:hypothetical protein